MVPDAYTHRNSPDRGSAGPDEVPIIAGPVPATTGSRRRVKWLTGAALTIALFAAGTAGSAVATHTRTSGPTAFRQWWAGASKDFADMRNASGDVDQAFNRFRPGGLAAACQHVRDAAEVKMQSHLPSPDRKLNAELNAAIGDFHFATHLCLTGVAGSPGDYDGEFLSLMSQANTHMRAAQDIVDQMLTNV
jgi:hypothetical protein